MQFYTEKHQQARNLYFNDGKPSGEIAETLGLDRKTVYNWIKQGKWQEMKISAQQAPGILLQNVHNHIGEINKKINRRHIDDRCPTMLEVDMLRKLVNITKSIHKINTGAYMQSFQELGMFISNEEPELADKVNQYADRYIQGNIANLPFNLKPESRENVAQVEKNLAQYDKTIPYPEIPCATHEPGGQDDVYKEWKKDLGQFLKNQNIEVPENIEEPWQPSCNPEPTEGHPEPAACHPELAEGHPELAARHPEPAACHPELAEGQPAEGYGEIWGNAKKEETTTEATQKPATTAIQQEINNAITVESYPQNPEISIGEMPQDNEIPQTFHLHFKDFYDGNQAELAQSGVFCIFEIPGINFNSPKPPTYLNVVVATDNILLGILDGTWDDTITPGFKKAIAYAHVANAAHRERVAAALIHHHDPLFNDYTYYYNFPFPETTINITGYSLTLNKSFTV